MRQTQQKSTTVVLKGSRVTFWSIQGNKNIIVLLLLGISGVCVVYVVSRKPSAKAAQERSESVRADRQRQCAGTVNPDGTSVN